jgi:hypothetical protein
MTDRKRRSVWPCLTAALIGLPVLYVASFGPVIGLCRRASPPVDRDTPVGRSIYGVYFPMYWLAAKGPKPVADAIVWYGQIFWP